MKSRAFRNTDGDSPAAPLTVDARGWCGKDPPGGTTSRSLTGKDAAAVPPAGSAGKHIEIKHGLICSAKNLASYSRVRRTVAHSFHLIC